jgi:formylglycine-generating enzyme required for sulfatase activity
MAATRLRGVLRRGPEGLYDMHGNVWEWVEDSWHANYDGAPTDGSAWLLGGDPSYRVVRGGSWRNESELVRAAVRLRRNASIGSIPSASG